MKPMFEFYSSPGPRQRERWIYRNSEKNIIAIIDTYTATNMKTKTGYYVVFLADKFNTQEVCLSFDEAYNYCLAALEKDGYKLMPEHYKSLL